MAIAPMLGENKYLEKKRMDCISNFWLEKNFE